MKYKLYTDAKLRKGGRNIAKLSEQQFADKVKELATKIFKEGDWVFDKINNTSSSAKIIGYLPSVIRKIYWDDKKGETKIKQDFKGITPDWENYDKVGNLRTVKGAPYIIMSVGGDWETPLCVMVYHDGKEFRCYIPEKGNTYRKDTKCLLGNIDPLYNSETGEYNTYEWNKGGKHYISDSLYVFNQLVKQGDLDKNDTDKISGLAKTIDYDTNMCIEDFSERVEVKAVKENLNNMNTKKLYESIMQSVSKEIKTVLNENKIPNKRVSKKILSPLKSQIIYSNIALNEPIYSNVSHSIWYRSFVLNGGAVFVEKIMGMDVHTFVCNTKEANIQAQKWILKNVPDYEL